MREGGHLAQYGTPADILANPADEFVARFVGADRGLKRLSLTTLAELELPQPNGHSPSLRLPDTMSARDALSALLTDGGGGALVVEAGGAIRGIATIDELGRLLSDATPPRPAVPEPAPTAPEDDA
jgi:osmoprotectant transport system ATP-binding protein